MQMGIFYFVSPRVTRSLAYGLAARNRLDMYRPPAKRKRPPNGYRVVIYITGSGTHWLEGLIVLRWHSVSPYPHATQETCDSECAVSMTMLVIGPRGCEPITIQLEYELISPAFSGP